MKTFWQAFEKKDFIAAQKRLVKLSSEEQEAILANLFQQSQYANTPHSVSVLFRELHDDKNFNDFHDAWLPPEDKCHPLKEFGKTYRQFFKAPIRVINAVNLKNPKEIVSIGLHWFNEEQEKGFWEMMKDESLSNDKANQQRADSVQEVADHKSSDIFLVKADDNLGTPF
jgi:hypothetical protein